MKSIELRSLLSAFVLLCGWRGLVQAQNVLPFPPTPPASEARLTMQTSFGPLKFVGGK